MEKWEIEVKEHWNKISDSEWYQSLRTDDRLSELYNNPETAFAFALMGAKVTSADISERQLENARHY